MARCDDVSWSSRFGRRRKAATRTSPRLRAPAGKFREPKSLRKAGKRPSGGQPGHRGSTLKRAAQVPYEASLSDGKAVDPPAPPSGKWGRTRQCFPIALLLRRPRDYAEDVLRFARHPRVRFGNNLAEQAIRMPMVKQKVTGCFRAAEGAIAFCIIRSCLATP